MVDTPRSIVHCMLSSRVPRLQGVDVPLVGYGTYKVSSISPAQTDRLHISFLDSSETIKCLANVDLRQVGAVPHSTTIKYTPDRSTAEIVVVSPRGCVICVRRHVTERVGHSTGCS